MKPEVRSQISEVSILPPRKRDKMGRFLPTSDFRSLTSGSKAGGFKNWGGYEGANWWSQNRGYVYYPTLDTRRDLDSYTLYELRRRSRWLYINSGFATRCIDGIANMVGALTPVPQTDDKDWNQAALKSFNNNAANQLVFDIGARFNFWSAQPMLTSLRMIDGDILSVLSESAGGTAALQFYEAHQLDNSTETQLDQTQWQNGVRTTPQGRPIQYRIVTGDNANIPGFSPYDNGQRSVDIDSADAIFHVEYRRPGRIRGEPALRHAINHLLDRNEIIAFTKTSIKNASTIGWQIVRNAPQFLGGPMLAPRGMGAGVQEVIVQDGSPNGTKIKAENPFGAGKQAEMDPGEEIKLLLDQRPHPNQVEFLDYLARDISWGLRCSPDILWNIAKLGGATVRYVMADAQQTLIEPMQQLLADQFCTRFWVYYVAKEMKSGRLAKCQDPMFWKVGWQPQRKLTVDIGRDGKLYIDMHKSGMITLSRFHAMQGQNWQTELDQYLDERLYIVKGIETRGMTYDQAFPPEPGSANITQREQLATSPENQPEKLVNAPNAKGSSFKNMDFWKALALFNKKSDGPSVAINVPPINIPTPNIVIDKLAIPEQKAPIVNVQSPAIYVPAPIVNVAAPPPPPPPVVNVQVNPTPVTVQNEIKMPATKSIKFNRDKDGKITAADVQ